MLVRRGGDRLLFDCAEGTQRQLMRSVVGLPDLEEIYLTHFHADHYLGLPGMLKTFALRQREVPLTVYGPPGLQELFGSLRRVFGRLTYTVEWSSCAPGRRSSATATASSCSRSTTASRRSGTPSSRTPGPAASTSRRPTRSASRTGPSAERCSAASRSRWRTGAS